MAVRDLLRPMPHKRAVASLQPFSPIACDHFLVEGRRELRKPVQLPAVLRSCIGGRFSVTLLDISERGCAITCSQVLRIDSYLTLAISSFATLGGTIVWNKESRSGIKFAVPLHVAIVDRLIALGDDNVEPAQYIHRVGAIIAPVLPPSVRFLTQRRTRWESSRERLQMRRAQPSRGLSYRRRIRLPAPLSVRCRAQSTAVSQCFFRRELTPSGPSR